MPNSHDLPFVSESSLLSANYFMDVAHASPLHGDHGAGIGRKSRLEVFTPSSSHDHVDLGMHGAASGHVQPCIAAPPSGPSPASCFAPGEQRTCASGLHCQQHAREPPAFTPSSPARAPTAHASLPAPASSATPTHAPAVPCAAPASPTESFACPSPTHNDVSLISVVQTCEMFSQPVTASFCSDAAPAPTPTDTTTNSGHGTDSSSTGWTHDTLGPWHTSA
jgi:hypothetical protein